MRSTWSAWFALSVACLPSLGACGSDSARAPGRSDDGSGFGGLGGGGPAAGTGGRANTGGGDPATGGSPDETGGAQPTTSAIWHTELSCLEPCGGDIVGTSWVMLDVCGVASGTVACWDANVNASDPPVTRETRGALVFGALDGESGPLELPAALEASFVVVPGVEGSPECNAGSLSLAECPAVRFGGYDVESCGGDDTGACVCPTTATFAPPAGVDYRLEGTTQVYLSWQDGSDVLGATFDFCQTGDLLVITHQTDVTGWVFGRAD